tara:strand:- start:2630 stop:2968 length:339 start_codon:yes stop_codon:yes gene_type:complete
MHDLKRLVKEYLDDTLWEAECVLRSDRSKNITIITDNLRGVCGITVVTVIGPAEPVGSTVERSILKIKFFRSEPTVAQQLKRMSIDARKIDGIYSFIPLRTKKVISRIYHPR